jgi:FtsP/CotA-like multicopper oxidase with cupredoxin domain
MDTGLPDNPLNLPASPYEKAYAIQDRMFTDEGQLFYPAFPGDPAYEGFITDEGVRVCGIGVEEPCIDAVNPTALAEFFGDHMVVNGIAWPKEDVEPRRYRLHILNGCDSRFMGIRFRQAASLTATTLAGAGPPLNFTVIGSDQGLASEATQTNLLIFEPGSRYDIIFDFRDLQNNRIIMENIGGDAPFNGDLFVDLTSEQIEEAVNAGDLFPDRQTDRIMAFDVAGVANINDSFVPSAIAFGSDVGTPTRIRKVALFEGKDEYGRLQPLLGTAEPATDFIGMPINWPDTAVYRDAGLIGQMEGASAWHSPTTENPALNSTEEWEIWNGTGDAHPVHLHLVHFEIVGRREIVWDSRTTEDSRVLEPGNEAGDGTFLVAQPVVQHNGAIGSAFRFANLTPGADVTNDTPANGYVENARHDMVTALPDQITYIRAKFDKPGRFVWHCHILSHEDHEMMKTLYVGPVTGP